MIHRNEIYAYSVTTWCSALYTKYWNYKTCTGCSIRPVSWSILCTFPNMWYTRNIVASSLANNLKLVGSPDTCTCDSSSTPSSPSKSPRRRKSSNGLVELINKFGGHSKLKRPPSQVQLNDEVKEQLASKSPSQSPNRGRLSKLWPPPQT